MSFLDGKGTCRNILSHYCTRARVRTIAHGHWCDKHRVGTGAAVVADGGAVLVNAVIVHKNRGGADVGFAAHRGIADVGEVGDLGTFADLRVLGLHEAAELATRTQGGAGADVGEGTHGGLIADHTELTLGAHDGSVTAHLHIGEGGVGADDGTVTNLGGTPQLRVGVDGHVLADFHVHADPGCRRVDDGGAGAHCTFHEAAVELLASRGELHAVINTGELAGIGGGECSDLVAVVTRDAQHIRDVQLALRIVRIDAG